MVISDCPLCAGPMSVMGVLGSALYFQCRNCGAQTWAWDEESEETPK